MEYNARTEGVRPGSVTTSHEVMILICYLMDQAGQPVSFQELSAALQGQELVNYFQLVEAVETLLQGGGSVSWEILPPPWLWRWKPIGKFCAISCGSREPGTLRLPMGRMMTGTTAWNVLGRSGWIPAGLSLTDILWRSCIGGFILCGIRPRIILKL